MSLQYSDAKVEVIDNVKMMSPPAFSMVEVLSPKTAKLDRGRKKDLYQQNDVKEYWIIEPDKKEIEVYLLKDGVYDLDNIYRISDPETDDDPEGAVMSFSVSTFPDLVVNLEEIFEYVNLWEQQ